MSNLDKALFRLLLGSYPRSSWCLPLQWKTTKTEEKNNLIDVARCSTGSISSKSANSRRWCNPTFPNRIEPWRELIQCCSGACFLSLLVSVLCQRGVIEIISSNLRELDLENCFPSTFPLVFCFMHVVFWVYLRILFSICYYFSSFICNTLELPAFCTDFIRWVSTDTKYRRKYLIDIAAKHAFWIEFIRFYGRIQRKNSWSYFTRTADENGPFWAVNGTENLRTELLYAVRRSETDRFRP